MTRRRRLGAVAALTVLLSGAAACGDDESPKPQADPPTSGSTSAAPATPTTTPAPPSVTPAAGLELVEETSAVRVPAGWVQMDANASFASAATEPGKLNSVQLVDSGDISGGAALDALAQGTLETLPKGADAQRLPDVFLGGVPAFHIHYTVPHDPQEYDVVTTIRNDRNVGLDFILDKKLAATNPDLIASVLATFRWTA